MPILVELTAAAPETNETSAASLQPDGSGSDLQQWRDEAMCGEHRAIDRAKWLVENQGKVMQEATLQVMREFPAAFDGAGAEEGRDSFITSASPRPARRRCSRRPDGSNQRRVPATGRTHFHDVIPRNLRNAAAMFAVLREPCERFASSYDFVRRPDAYKMHPLEPVHTFKEGVDGAIEWAKLRLHNESYRLAWDQHTTKGKSREHGAESVVLCRMESGRLPYCMSTPTRGSPVCRP